MKLSALKLAQSLYDAILENPSKRKTIVKNFLNFLTRKRQKRLLPLVIRSLQSVEQNRTKTTLVTIETPYELSQKTLEAIKKAIKQKYHLINVNHRLIINPSLLAGSKISFDDVVIDDSAKIRLEQLTHES